MKYVENKDVDSGDGGDVQIIESKAELERLEDIHIDIKTSIPEHTNSLQCNDGRTSNSTLILVL